MKTVKFILVGMISLLMLPLLSYGQGNIITAGQFMKMYKTNKSLCVIDAGKTNSYIDHIENAISIPHNSLYKSGKIHALIQTPERLAEIFGNKGVGQNSDIVLYDGGSQKYSSREYWILKYLGADHVWILHKDLAQWRKAKIPMTSVPGRKNKTKFISHVNPSLYASTHDVQNTKSVLIDCRTSGEYFGIANNSEGHLPGAININYTTLLTPDRAFKAKEAILEIFQKHGVKEGDPIILYCKTSIRAAVDFVALKNILDWPNVKLYDGAYVAWVYTGLPVGKTKVEKTTVSQH